MGWCVKVGSPVCGGGVPHTWLTLHAIIFHISLCHLCDFTEPMTAPRKVEEHGENKMKKVEERGENKLKRKEGDKKVMNNS
jgi:hypothetical protein